MQCSGCVRAHCPMAAVADCVPSECSLDEYGRPAVSALLVPPPLHHGVPPSLYAASSHAVQPALDVRAVPPLHTGAPGSLDDASAVIREADGAGTGETEHAAALRLLRCSRCRCCRPAALEQQRRLVLSCWPELELLEPLPGMLPAGQRLQSATAAHRPPLSRHRAPPALDADGSEVQAAHREHIGVADQVTLVLRRLVQEQGIPHSRQQASGRLRPLGA